jgi:hypothetical protein
VEGYKHEHNKHGMVCLVQSPDINIIDSCWLRVERNRAGEITNPNQLFEAILDIWITFLLEYNTEIAYM